MKRFTSIMVLTLALIFVVGVSVAMAAPGDYAPATTSDKYTTALTSGAGKVDSTIVSPNLLGTNANKSGIDPATGKTVDDTGVNTGIIKNLNGQRTHGEYQNNTNSCASCHQTHTASGKKLLFKNGTYNTCTACHDGTLGFYNVFTSSNAGTFGGNPDKAIGNASVHLATGVMTVSAAPGGNRTSTDAKSWGKEFNCASCHSPHGSYSSRLLNYNPNNVGNRLPADGGIKIANANVSFDSATGHFTAVDVAGKVYGGPWLYGYDYGKPKKYFTQIRVFNSATSLYELTYPGDPSKSWNDVLKVNYRGAYFTDPNGVLAGIPASQIQMDIAPATVVSFDLTKDMVASLPNAPVFTVNGYNSGVSTFCAACHSDYNSNSAQTETGSYSKAFRHKIVQGLKVGMMGEPVTNADGTVVKNATMVCLSCHFAHGTDVSVMKDAADVAVTAPDVNASSALKRYVNMAVCWKCHSDSKAEQFKNNDSFWDNYGTAAAPNNAPVQ